MRAASRLVLYHKLFADVIIGSFGLQHLNLDYNKVSEQSFPDTFDRLNLEWLSVRYNGCDPIPTNLPKITTLETLRLDGNGIKVLPEEIGQLHRLKTLHLSQNDLHDLPEGLSGCTSLTGRFPRLRATTRGSVALL